MPEQGGVDKVLHRVDVLRHARDQIAGPRLSVFGERQPLNAVIEQKTEIVRDPLAHTGREVLFDVGANGTDDRDQHHRGERELQHRRRVVAEHADDRRVEQPRQMFPLQNVVDDDRDRPGFEHVAEGFADDGHERQNQRLPVRAENASEQKPIGPEG